MECRMIRATDVEDVCRLEKVCFSKPWSRKSFEDAIQRNDSVYVVGVQNNKLVGYCGIWCAGEEGDICNMAIDPKQRGCGFGKQLLQWAMEKSVQKGVSHIFLEVRETNVAAIHVYEQAGFSQIGKRKNYYSCPTEDAILMEWKS